MDNWLAVTLPVALSSLAALGVALLTYRTNRKDISRQEKADAMTIYSKLIADMQAMIDLNNVEVARLRKEQQEMKARLDEERDAWAEERKALVRRIAELEKINARLEAQIAELREVESAVQER